MKHILIVSHCILNNAAKVAQDEASLAEEYRQRDELIRAVLDHDVQMLQLPCPELLMYGTKRWGHVKDQFDNPFFRAKCRTMLEPVVMQIEEYTAHPDKFNIIGIVAVDGSPSCGYSLTCRGDWGGELGAAMASDSGPAAEVRMVSEPGVYMEELDAMLEEHSLDIGIFSISDAAARIKRIV